MAEQPAKYPLQTKFWKSFGQYGIFLGTVVGYDAADGMYKCYYEGDGDKEDLTEEEIEGWLKRYPSVAKINEVATKKQNRTTEDKTHKEQARKSTLKKRQSSTSPTKVEAPRKEYNCKAFEEGWKENLQKLKAFREAHGHTCVPRGWPQDPSFARWVSKQRQQFKEGTIQSHRQTLLEQVGFEFCTQVRSWNETYQLMVDHKKKFGGFSNITHEGPHQHLYNWIRNQKNAYWRGRLPADRKKCLEKMGLNLQNQKRTFEENFHLLLEFQKTHGHTNIPRGHQDQALAGFVYKKRWQYGTSKIPHHQKEKLERIGFQFRLREKPYITRTFEQNCELLLDFKGDFGHLNVPRSWDKALALWVANVRRGKTKLKETQKKKLSGIGFEWRRQRTWQESFDALLSYQKKHGNCDVPFRYKKDAALGYWVCRHKKPNVYSGLNPEKKAQLKAIGFHPNQGANQLTSGLESNWSAQHVSKRKKCKTVSNAGSNQMAPPPTKSTRSAKQKARQMIENQVDQESSDDLSASDSYNSDESSASEESITTSRLDTACLMGERPEEAISSQSNERHSGPEAAPDKAESSLLPTQSTGAARRRRGNASCVVPDLARSASGTVLTVSKRSGHTHPRTRAKAAAQAAVPCVAKSEPHGKDIVVPDSTESSSVYAPAGRTSPGRDGKRRMRLQKEKDSSKKPRWLFNP